MKQHDYFQTCQNPVAFVMISFGGESFTITDTHAYATANEARNFARKWSNKTHPCGGFWKVKGITQ